MTEDWGRYIEVVADALLGKPTSKEKGALRYGKRGSLKVNTERGFWDDFEAGDSGGTLALIKREKGLEGGEAIDWMRDELGLDIEDRRPQLISPPRAKSARPARDPDQKPAKQEAKPKLIKTYDYTAESGELLFQVCRMEPKNFLQRRRPRDGDDPSDIKGGWVWRRDGIAQVPYRLTELTEAIADERATFLVEGEKDVDNLWDLGVPATTMAGGAGKWPDELTPYFKDADVVILPDNDPQTKNPKTGELLLHPDGKPKLPGQDHARMVAGKLKGVAKSVRILELPSLPSKGDVSDWLEAGGTSGELYALAKSAKPYESERFVSKFGAFVWGETRTTRTPYQYLVKGLIPRRESVLIYGASQSGKSFLTQHIAMAVTRGGYYCGRKVRRGLVIYCAAEAGLGFIDLRMPGYAVGNGIDVNEFLPFVCLSKKFDLFGSETQVVDLIGEIKKIVAAIKAKCAELRIEDIELEAVVIDTLNKVTPAMDEISGKDVGLVMARLDRIKEECGCGLWLVHHMNAAGERPRGHTSLYAAFETAIKVSRSPDEKYNDDGKPRDKRFMQIEKQREGEDGGKYPFYLRGFTIGVDEDGDPIPACTVEWLDEGRDQSIKSRPRPQVQESAAAMTDQNRMTYRALRRALDEYGTAAPPSLGLPKSIGRVVDRKYWGQVYRQNFAADDSEDAVRKALQRGNNFMIRNGFIARSNPWVWITGKSIRGEPKRPDPIVLEDDVAVPDEEASDSVDWSTMGQDDQPADLNEAGADVLPALDGAALQPPLDAAQMGSPAE